MLEIGILRAVFFQIRNRSKTLNHPAGESLLRCSQMAERAIYVSAYIYTSLQMLF